jgi:hypothetical protein
MPSKLSDTHYGETRVARHHRAVADSAPPTPQRVELAPIGLPTATKAAATKEAKKKLPVLNYDKDKEKPVKAVSPDDTYDATGLGEVYDDSEETDDTDSFEPKPKKKKK